MPRSVSCLIPFVLLTGAAAAQDALPPSPCDGDDYRRFDFWIGEWDVHAGDRLAGHNRIERVADGCALAEHWTGARGGHGESLNAWDAAAGVWRQLWMGRDGQLLQLAGGWNGKAMVLEGVAPAKDADQPALRHRISWTPGTGTPREVVQRWESSTDGGETWTVLFLGSYRPRGQPGDASPGTR